MRRPLLHSGIVPALFAAALFGASTPLAKGLVGEVGPVLLAGLLYLGSGVGLGLWWLWRRSAQRPHREAALTARDVPWLAGAIVTGGIVGPVLLMTGLLHTSGATAALLLNLETVFTALLAWFVFKENVGSRIALGMVLIVAGGAALAWPVAPGSSALLGMLAIAMACLCWAIDNNLTRKVSAADPVQIAGLKGLVAGGANVGVALAAGAALPAPSIILGATVVGFAGYGISLVLFVIALRHLGSARTGAYFATAPFLGAALSLVLLRETAGTGFWIAGALMAGGVWLHLTERHEHMHMHESLTHGHRHVHDEHHRHAHEFPCDETEPHTHSHVHAPLLHSHPHYPDIHHRHRS